MQVCECGSTITFANAWCAIARNKHYTIKCIWNSSDWVLLLLLLPAQQLCCYIPSCVMVMRTLFILPFNINAYDFWLFVTHSRFSFDYGFFSSLLWLWFTASPILLVMLWFLFFHHNIAIPLFVPFFGMYVYDIL